MPFFAPKRQFATLLYVFMGINVTKNTPGPWKNYQQSYFSEQNGVKMRNYI
jgi:hypothetical protein